MACVNNGTSTRINLIRSSSGRSRSFEYLGSIFTSDGNCTQDIRKRLALGRSAMQSLSSVWKSKNISTATKVRLLKALVWSIAREWRLNPSQQRRKIYWSFWNVVLSEAIKDSVDATQEEWMDSVKTKSWQRTFEPCEVIEIGILWPNYMEIRKSGEANGPRMCTRLQKSWSTTPTLDEWHHGMDWDEDEWSGCSSGRLWLLERNTMRC